MNIFRTIKQHTPKSLKRHIRFMLLKNTYTKYKEGPIHWQWYFGEGHDEYRNLVDETVELFDDVVPGTLVDIGAGDGLVDHFLVEKGFSVTGVEPVESAIAYAKTKLPTLEVQNMTVEEFAKKNKQNFDYMLSVDTIEHVKDYGKFRDIMKFINKFAIIITDDGALSKETNEFHYKEFTIEELKKIFIGYRVEEIFLKNKKMIGVKVWKK